MKDKNGVELLPFDLVYVISRVKGFLDNAETDIEETISSDDELIAIGKREALLEVMPLLRALKRKTVSLQDSEIDRVKCERKS